MNIKIKSGRVCGSLQAIPSKSYAHRISICNFLAGKNPSAGCLNFSSKDIEATENCLRDLSLGKTRLDCGESGSTLRFLLPLLSALGGEFELTGKGRLLDRPNEELFRVFNQHGVTSLKEEVIKIKGKLTAGDYLIRGDISSQYVSGLLMALPLLDGDSKIILSTPLASRPYVDITLEVLALYGIEITSTDFGFMIKGNQKYQGSARVEGDWSNSAFFMVLGAISGEVEVFGLNLDSVQGDKQILDILSLAGAKVEIGKGIKVSQSKLKAFCYDAQDCPDLVPITAVLASYAEGETVIKNIERLKIKESDRVQTTQAMLEAFGIESSCDGNALKIKGGKPKGGIMDSFNDHRIVMSSAVLASGAKGESLITNAQAVSKSYPTFFEDYNSLGGVSYEER